MRAANAAGSKVVNDIPAQGSKSKAVATRQKVQELASGRYTQELIQTARDICAAGKGILAADESTGTIGKRFD